MECISLVNKDDRCNAPSYLVRRRTGKARMGEGDVLTTSGSTEKVSSRASSEEDDDDEGEVEGEGGVTTDLLTSSSSRTENHHQKGASATRHRISTETRNLPEKCFGCGLNMREPCWCSGTAPNGIVISGNINKKTLQWSTCLVSLFLVMALLRLYKRCFACCAL